MTSSEKAWIATATLVSVVLLSFIAFAPDTTVKTFGGPSSGRITASSTRFTLTTTSQMLLATSSARIAATVQPFHCTVGVPGTTYLSDTNPAVATAGFGVTASSTLTMGDTSDIPLIPTSSLYGITDAGTCLVYVKEWRLN